MALLGRGVAGYGRCWVWALLGMGVWGCTSIVEIVGIVKPVESEEIVKTVKIVENVG